MKYDFPMIILFQIYLLFSSGKIVSNLPPNWTEKVIFQKTDVFSTELFFLMKNDSKSETKWSLESSIS